jgi:hypothetical protein
MFVSRSETLTVRSSPMTITADFVDHVIGSGLSPVPFGIMRSVSSAKLSNRLPSFSDIVLFLTVSKLTLCIVLSD